VGHVVHSGASGSGSHSAFQCVWGVKRRRTIFHARVVECGLQKKCVRTYYAELVFLHPVGSTGHVVNFGASGGGGLRAM
jgi:hypothetical protein